MPSLYGAIAGAGCVYAQGPEIGCGMMLATGIYIGMPVSLIQLVSGLMLIIKNSLHAERTQTTFERWFVYVILAINLLFLLFLGFISLIN